MQTLRRTLLATAAIVFVPIAVSAQDWDGAYGGLTVGYAFGDATHSFSNGAPTDNSSPTGALFGGFVGYAFQTGTTGWGGEADLELSNYSGSFINTTGATSQGTIDGNWQGSIRGVLGLAGSMAGKPALYYATAGWAVGEFDFLGGPSAPVPPGGGYSEQMSGWTRGSMPAHRCGSSTGIPISARPAERSGRPSRASRCPSTCNSTR